MKQQWLMIIEINVPPPSSECCYTGLNKAGETRSYTFPWADSAALYAVVSEQVYEIVLETIFYKFESCQRYQQHT